MIGYLDLPSGISGDMFLGCLVDGGWPIESLRETVAGLGLPPSEWSVEAKSVMKGPLRATLVDVVAQKGHHHRHLKDILAIIDRASLPPRVKERASAVFARLAGAEAKVHGTTPEKIHFHEVGAVDAIIDVIATVAGLEALGVEKLYASALPLGTGWAETEHGKLPLPAPATLEILAGAKAPTRPAPGPGEWVTPTGAALVAELAAFTQPLMNLERIALGAGQKDCPWPNVARLWLGAFESHGPLVELETNIDDMNPQLFPAVSEKLFSLGAKDVWFQPIQMKKNRPAILLTVLGRAEDEAVLSRALFEQTTTLGVRVKILHHRHEARRELRTVDTPYGKVSVKLKWLESRAVGAMPEYEDCRGLAAASGVPVKDVMDAATAEALALLVKLRA